MATVVILPGGFHPYHAGHYALYQSARRTFPDADVYVAATDDRSQRPFPFKIKEKLATLAGVEPGHFVQVRSPFRAEEITSRFNPEQDTLIFVRSTKDAKEPPIPGGVLKSGKPAYLQPLLGAKRLEPFAKHAYMAYLPTVEFGPGITSASEIRAAWPGLDDRRKTALVMSLYPKTQGNPRLAATVVKMLDTAIVSEEVFSPIAEGEADYGPEYQDMVRRVGQLAKQGPLKTVWDPVKRVYRNVPVNPPKPAKDVDENQGWAATLENTVGYIQEENPDYIEEKWSQKYKRSINCNNPRGFSQRAHCAGRKK